MNKISGVYIIKNIINDKIYIGSSIDIRRRFNEHKKKLRHNYHTNNYLQSAWNKYGEKSFTFDLLEEHGAEYILSMEQWWMNMTNSANRLYGYNLSPTATNTMGSKRTKEQIEKISSQNCKKVYQFNLDGSFLNDYISLKEAERQTGISFSSISNAIYGRLKTAGGFLWSYTTTTTLPIFKSPGIPRISVNCFNLSGKFINNYKSLYEAERETGASSGIIVKVCEGNAMSSGGYLWSYTETPPVYEQPKLFTKPVICLDLNGNFVAKYKSIVSASKETGVHNTSIQKVCKGKEHFKTAGGYIWKYES